MFLMLEILTYLMLIPAQLIYVSLACVYIISFIFNTSNEISQSSTSEEVEIVKNPVYLADLVNNHPVVFGDKFVWNLTFHNYGEDTCTLWTYSNISHTVLFGREDCKLRPSMNR